MSGYKIQRFRGNSCEIGLYVGHHVKGRLRSMIDHFIKAVDRAYHLDFSKLEKEAVPWMAKLPEEFLLELESLAYGAGVRVERIAQWIYCDRLVSDGCTSLIYNHEDIIWVGRNHDYAGPNLWRSINIIEKEAHIPVVLFVQEGGLFSKTGYNTRRLWLHYHALPAWDIPAPEEKTIPPFVFIRMALEKCSNISEVERLLETTVRDGGMNLFVVDGKNNTFAVLECTCRDYVKRQSNRSYIAGSNHYVATKTPRGFKNGNASSVSRLDRMDSLLATIKVEDPYRDFIRILSDPGVEQNHGVSGTVYSNLACPSQDRYYYACNGFPAASRAPFEEVIFP